MKGYNSVSDDFDWFDHFSEELHLSSRSIEEAEEMYEEELKRNIRGDDLILLTVAVYIKSRQNKETRSMRQFANVISTTIFNKRRDTTAKKMQRIYNKIRDKLDIDMRTPQPKEQIPYISRKLDIDSETEKEIITTCEKITKMQELTGRSCACISGSATYIKTDFSSEEVSKVTVTGKASIENVVQLLKENGGEELIDESKVAV